MIIDLAYRLGSYRLNSWHRAAREGSLVRRFDACVLGGPERETVYRFDGFEVDWRGNVTRRFGKVP